MVAQWLLLIESAALTVYVIAGEIRLARLSQVPVDYALHLVVMWTFTLISWAFVTLAFNPLHF